MNHFGNFKKQLKKLSNISPSKIFKHFYIIILAFILNTTVSYAGDNSDKILYSMIVVMIVSAIGIVSFIVFESKKKLKK